MQTSKKALEDQLERVRELESRLTFRLSVLSKRLDQQASDMLKGTPINLSSYRFLNVINTFEAISIADASRFIAMDRALASRTALGLEKLGLVRFQSDPGNKRKKLVVLTDAGGALITSLLPHFEGRRAKIEAHLGDDLLRALSECLDLLEETVEP